MGGEREPVMRANTAYVIRCQPGKGRGGPWAYIDRLKLVWAEGFFSEAFQILCEEEFGPAVVECDRISRSVGIAYSSLESEESGYFKRFHNGYSQRGKLVVFGFCEGRFRDPPEPPSDEFRSAFAAYVRRKSLIWRAIEECGLKSYHSGLELTSCPVVAKGIRVDPWTLDPSRELPEGKERDWHRIGAAIRSVVHGTGMWPCDVCDKVDFCNESPCGFGCRICDRCKQSSRLVKTCACCLRSKPGCS